MLRIIMQTTQKIENINKPFYNKEVVTPIAVTIALMGIALAAADRFGLSLEKKIIAAGAPAWGAAALYLIDHQLNEFGHEIQNSLRNFSL